ncbi:MAG: ATP cone domain-containing protein [Candidatus Nanohaloarchaea archaeon]
MDARIVDSDNRKQEFETEKLYESVYYPAREAELSEEEASELADKVVYEVKSWMGSHEDSVFTSREIREKVKRILDRCDDEVCFLYESHLDIN